MSFKPRPHRLRWKPDDNPTTVHGDPVCTDDRRFRCACCGNDVCWCRGCDAYDHTAEWCDWCAVHCTETLQRCCRPPRRRHLGWVDVVMVEGPEP